MNEISESTIRKKADSDSYSRGAEYYRNGAVGAIFRRGNLLQAEVEGSEVRPYKVTVSFDAQGVANADCSCPYAQATNWCKHVVATLLTLVNKPESVQELPQLETLLAPLDRNELQNLVLNLVSRKPELAMQIELEIGRLRPATSSNSMPQSAVKPAEAPKRPVVSEATVRRQVSKALNDANNSEGDRWDDNYSAKSDALSEGLETLFDIVQSCIDSGDGRAALPILEAMTEELIDGWDEIGDFIGEGDELFEDIGELWAEAILSADLSVQERDDWVETLEALREAGAGTAASSELEVAINAASFGWDSPPLIRVLKGEITENGAWEGDPPECAAQLAIVRLNILERQGRLQEAVYLSKAEGEHDRHTALLVRMGKTKEAAEYGMEALSSSDSALRLAKILDQSGEKALAVLVGVHGLTLSNPSHALATWLRDTALEAGETEIAILASKTALKLSPQLNDYTLLKQISGDQWPALRTETLQILRTSETYDLSGKVDIYISEGLMSEALDIVRKNDRSRSLAAIAVEAATPTLPLEVIPICAKHAESIMDAGQAGQYEEAARWVERARDAYRVAKQEERWQAYKAGLLAKHQRKYKLVPLLRNL